MYHIISIKKNKKNILDKYKICDKTYNNIWTVKLLMWLIKQKLLLNKIFFSRIHSINNIYRYQRYRTHVATYRAAPLHPKKNHKRVNQKLNRYSSLIISPFRGLHWEVIQTTQVTGPASRHRSFIFHEESFDSHPLPACSDNMGWIRMFGMKRWSGNFYIQSRI